MRAFHAFLLRRDEIEDVLAEVLLPKAEKQLPRFMTAEPEVESLIGGYPGKPKNREQAPVSMAARDTAIVELFSSTGMRLSELAGLDVVDVDVIGETARVMGKGGREAVSVGGPALEAISRYRHVARVHSGALFSTNRGRLSARNIWAMIRTRLVQAGLPSNLSPHKLRHSSAHPPARQRRGPSQRADVARSREPVDHTDLHACDDRAPQACLPSGSSARRRPVAGRC